MKLVRLINIKLENYETINIPKGEVWKINSDSASGAVGSITPSLYEPYPLVVSEGMRLKGMKNGLIMGLAFSENGNGIKLDKKQVLTIYLEENETYTIPKGKVFKGIMQGMTFCKGNKIITYATEGFVLKPKETEGYISGILFSTNKEV